jgi:uncharacterized membrane protein
MLCSPMLLFDFPPNPEPKDSAMNAQPAATSIEQYLAQLRAALADADPALLQDALYDAEEYLRSELAAQPGRNAAEVIAEVAGSYGAPEEVAEIYRQTEVKVARALKPPPQPVRRSTLGQFFGVAADPRTYAALFYLLLSLATGIFYFTWVVAGWSLSLGLSILIIGIPFIVLFFASTRLLSLVEGRIVETMLGERMPRRPLYSTRGQPWLKRIGGMFSDPRTWSTCLYMLLMLPLGILYFTVTITGFVMSLGLIVAPVVQMLSGAGWLYIDGEVDFTPPLILAPVIAAAGVALLFAMLHLVRGIGRLHGKLAKHLLVKVAQYD